MKSIFLIFFMSLCASIFCQTRSSGLWVLKEKSNDTLYLGELDRDVWMGDTAFTPITNDSVLSLYTYLRIPDAIQFEEHGMLLIYGDIMDMNSQLIVKSRGLRNWEGDCIFAWEPSTSMYEYVATWNRDHYAYFLENGKEYVYENVDPDQLSQQQKERIVPVNEMAMYWQGRLRPIESHYRCNISTQK